MNAADYTLLVVDDNEENRDVLSRRLSKKGFQVLVAAGGRQALEMIEAQPVDLVLLDIMMPDVNGIEVLEELRKTRSAADLPIIMATAMTESEDVVQALELGANDYVTKPIDFPVVLARVQAQLRVKKSKRAQQAAQQAEAVQRMLAGPEARPGGLIAERYRLESRIGSGAFGTVYRAIHLELDSTVAVKVLQTGVSADADAVARFRREGISACRVPASERGAERAAGGSSQTDWKSRERAVVDRRFRSWSITCSRSAERPAATCRTSPMPIRPRPAGVWCHGT